MRGFDIVEPGVFRDPRTGKIYTSVSYRTRQFRERHPMFGVDFVEVPYPAGNGATEQDPRGRFIKMRCEIRDETGRLIAVGHAEEDRKFGPVNKTSAIENAETSALGRALANLGFLSDQYASAEEVEQARARGRSMDAYEKGDHPAAVMEGVRAASEQKAPQEPASKPSAPSAPSEATDDDGNPYSHAFRDLLVQIGAAKGRAEMEAVGAAIKAAGEDLNETEVAQLRTQYLARRANLINQGGK
jgi:hypothetical protein